MASITGFSGSPRFDLITAGHHFLLEVLPFSQPTSRNALTKFVAAAQNMELSFADLDTVLLRCLVVMSKHTTGSIPSLVERYLSNSLTTPSCILRFSQCIDDLLRYHCIRDRSVQDAVFLINARYVDSNCTPAFVARSLDMRLSTLDVAFRRETGITPSDYIRDVRLEQAAILLATTNKSIKEVWAHVGYNHHSNFDHDFKRRFKITPREYRARALRPAAEAVYRRKQAASPEGCESLRQRQSVLIVDDDEGTRTIIGAQLELDGYNVLTASTGAQAMRELSRHSPDVILLDYRLEDMDGLAVLRTLRSKTTDKTPAVALFTADWNLVDKSDEIQALNAILVSKLCDLDRVRELIVYLSSEPTERPYFDVSV